MIFVEERLRFSLIRIWLLFVHLWRWWGDCRHRNVHMQMSGYVFNQIQVEQWWGCTSVDMKDDLQGKPRLMDIPRIDCITKKHPWGNSLRAWDINRKSNMWASTAKGIAMHNVFLCLYQLGKHARAHAHVHAHRPLSLMTELWSTSLLSAVPSDIQRLWGSEGPDEAWTHCSPGENGRLKDKALSVPHTKH